MPFSKTHDEWIQKGLVHAQFMLHVVPAGKGSWGQVEGLPVDVYGCDFEQYDPPKGFPLRDVCCIRTRGAWWIILTRLVFDDLQQLAQDGELSLGFAPTVTAINERQIGAWLLVRDKALSGEQAIEQMDQRLFKKYGQDYASVHRIFRMEMSDDLADLQFDEESFGKEPLESDAVEDEIVAFEQALAQKTRRPAARIRMKRFMTGLQRLNFIQRMKLAGVLALLVTVLVLECPRLWRLSAAVYGPATVDLKESFPKIRWIDRTSEAVMSDPRISRSLFQALSHRNPFKAAGSIVEVSVRESQMPDASKVYRWKILLDETGPQDEITAEMNYLSRFEMRGLQNTLSGYQSLKSTLAFKFFMKWGHEGRFIVLFTGVCVGGFVLLIRRVLKRVQEIETDMTVRDVAAGGRILESVAQDARAAENLMRFNQQRRLRMVDNGTAQAWEKEAFDWVEQNVDLETGKTRRQNRYDRLKEKRKRRQS